MIKIYYDKDKFIVTVGGVENFNGVIELPLEKPIPITLFPTFEKTLFIPITAWIFAKADNIICPIPHLKLSNNEFYLTPKFTPYIPPVPPSVDLQREFGEHMLTVYTDSLPRLLIENKYTFINVILPEKPTKLQEAVMDSGILFFCLCPNYLCVVFYDYNDYKLLIDKDCDNYAFDEKGVSFKLNLGDNQGRIYNAHLSFNGTEYICDSDSFEYENLHTPHEKLLGYDFLQAIMAEDTEYAKRLLLQGANIDMQNILTALDGIDEILLPKTFKITNDIYAFCEKGVKKCSFFTQNGFISAINIV